ncbi:MAG: BrnT family toxin [Candidatus Levybacteria bacterium]|nr:BrnT family toxin [Candidatus Levybacteria bacterium]
MRKTAPVKKPLVFEWDTGNKEKNVKKHNVQNTETEEVFVNDPVILPDRTHSQKEERYFAFGVTNKGRKLIVSFTLRGEQQERIRPIMSRDQSKKERAYYQEEKSEVTKEK